MTTAKELIKSLPPPEPGKIHLYCMRCEEALLNQDRFDTDPANAALIILAHCNDSNYAVYDSDGEIL